MIIGIVFFGICLGYYLNVLLKTDAHYIYPIDDAYIHLAIAKNFALYDVWGVTRYQFSSTSSSPLFTYLLSVMIKIFGNSDQLPLYFNMVFGIGTVYFLNEYFAGIFEKIGSIVCAVLFILLFSVLHLQLLSGMEHVFHVFLIVFNIFCFSRFQNKWAVFGFYFSLLLMGLVRFESMFYFVMLAFVFGVTKKWKEAILVLLVGFMPILIFGYFNEQQDGYFFPNSVVVKGTKLSFDSNFPLQLKSILLDNFLFNISFYKIGFFPVVISLILMLRSFKNKNNFEEFVKDHFLVIVFSLLVICHSMFADLKGMFRYEAYILVGFCMVLIPKMKPCFVNFINKIRNEKLISGLIIMNIVLMGYKLFVAHMMLEKGGKNVYEQQFQSARFLNTYYNTSKVVANDIGAITYYTDIHLLDIAGLGSVETIRFNEAENHFDKSFKIFLTEYCHKNKYEMAVVYENWLQGEVPDNWKKAAVLKIQDKFSVAQDEVSFYSIDYGNLQQLKNNIKNFNWNKNVQVTIVD
ncbi:hypothetical protein PFY12_11200 [Chryseobacterium camelliae]|uniref:Glycosyltransferase RgtA/B/C/D-like domain-containing protein n=1 Tax=Chryseobacterium camelliae TaxID=1265445 RepID=A0ABY7QLN5_9FLAO|nr:hypothetical protein [Chryseobacterium camelliae]WBV59621.1 hypothetical protein PFY12_11200 [Chryseobacterium camelliae]